MPLVADDGSCKYFTVTVL